MNEVKAGSVLKSITNQSPSFKKRYIAVDGRLKQITMDLKAMLLPDKPFRPMITYLAKDLITRRINLAKYPQNDISVYEFFKHRFGPDIADYAADPLCTGISGGNARELSMKSMFPGLLAKEQTHGSVVKGMMKQKDDIYQDLINDQLIQKSIDEKWSVFSFDRGIETFTDKMVQFLQNNYSQTIEMIQSTQVVGLKMNPDNKMIVNTKQSNGQALHLTVDHVFSSLLSSDLAKIISVPSFQDSLVSIERLTSTLASIPTAHMIVVCMQFDGQLLPSPDYGFGFLVPSKENANILGVTFDSCMFPQQSGQPDRTVLTVMMGGHQFQKLFGSPDNVDQDYVMHQALLGVRKYLNISAKPCKTWLAIHKDCIPQYNLGHDNRVQIIESELASTRMALSLIGSSYRGFSVPDCILNSRKQVDTWVQANKR